uniref:Uncharacterized protein n=1 Tax=viral metagenome TaxID=1070528 RepID=A0A6C0E4E4_9ZZZZ
MSSFAVDDGSPDSKKVDLEAQLPLTIKSDPNEARFIEEGRDPGIKDDGIALQPKTDAELLDEMEKGLLSRKMGGKKRGNKFSRKNSRSKSKKAKTNRKTKKRDRRRK